MQYSRFFIPTQKNISSDVKLISHIYMLKSGMIRQETAGIYSWLPLGYRVLKKIINIIEYNHDLNHINQILMPTIQSSDIWKISDRYETYGKEMLKINDRHGKELLYGPTNEEMITAIGKQYLKSYKDLPLNLYHIQSKFRDEIRPRFGVMRAREFLMKDAYSFDLSEKDSEKTYLNFFKMYIKIFQDLGLPIIPVRAPSGEIGGSISHEFHLVVDSGESEIHYDESISNDNFSEYNVEDLINIKSFTSDYKNNEQNKNLIKKKSIELGHIFLFGTKYSEPFDILLDSKDGKKFLPYMGSYGIGVSRIPAAVIEMSNDNKGIIWPSELAPFEVIIINLMIDNEDCCSISAIIYNQLVDNGIDTIIDDRNERAGKKFTDSELLGIPIRVTVGKQYIEKKKINVTHRDNSYDESLEITQLKELIINLRKIKE